MYNYLLFTSISMLCTHKYCKCEQATKKNIIFYHCILLYFFKYFMYYVHVNVDKLQQKALYFITIFYCIFYSVNKI